MGKLPAVSAVAEMQKAKSRLTDTLQNQVQQHHHMQPACQMLASVAMMLS